MEVIERGCEGNDVQHEAEYEEISVFARTTNRYPVSSPSRYSYGCGHLTCTHSDVCSNPNYPACFGLGYTLYLTTEARWHTQD
jgi:hypothetical protein